MENLFDKIERLGLGKTSIGDLINEVDHLHSRNEEYKKAYDAILDDCRIQEKRIAELEAVVARLRKALRGLYEHTKNDYQIAGLNTAAKEALESQRNAAIAAISEEGRKRGEVEANLAALVAECERVLKDMPLYGYNMEPRDILRQAISAALVTP